MAVDRWSANVGREYRRVVTELASFAQASVHTVRPAVASDARVSDEMGCYRGGPLAVWCAHGRSGNASTVDEQRGCIGSSYNCLTARPL